MRFSAFKKIIVLLLMAVPALAADPQVNVQADREEIAQDESVALKFSVEVEGSQVSVGEPHFKAPDFDEVNTYQSHFVQSFYENGHFGMRTTQQITKVLRPRRTGNLKISEIAVPVNGKDISLNPIAVHVTGAGAGTPPPQLYGGHTGLRGNGKTSPKRDFFVRTELSKNDVYKGEQVIVSYYLYRRVQVFNIQPLKFPVLNGFLREDLELPIAGRALNAEQVILDGVPYARSLLARYAAYPLQEGKLKIDTMTLKANYYARGGMGGFGDEDDPFSQFFRQLQPETAVKESDPLTIDVKALPTEGRPEAFTGGVGDFSVVGAIDKYDAKTGDALTLTVKVEGRGNVSAIQAPKISWPAGVDLFDSKGKTKVGQAGISEKIFEFILIPKQPGHLTVPPIDFGFFDPVQKRYVSKSTQAIDINVTGNALPSAVSSAGSSSAVSNVDGDQNKALEDIQYLKPPTGSSPRLQAFGLRIVFWAGLILAALFVSLVLFDLLKLKQWTKVKVKKSASKNGKELKSFFDNLGRVARDGTREETLSAFRKIEESILNFLAQRYPNARIRSLSRAELKDLLVSQGGAENFSADTWEKMERALEWSEAVQFSSSLTDTEMRTRLSMTIEDVKKILGTR